MTIFVKIDTVNKTVTEVEIEGGKFFPPTTGPVIWMQKDGLLGIIGGLLPLAQSMSGDELKATLEAMTMPEHYYAALGYELTEDS